MQQYVKDFIAGDHAIYTKYIYRSSDLMKSFHDELKRQLKDRDVKHYYYLITFTLKPNIDKEKYDKIEEYIISQMKRPALKITEAHYVREYTKNHIAHWHVSLSCLKCLPKNRFNYFEKLYGHVDISKTTDKSLNEGINYINKEQISIQIL